MDRIEALAVAGNKIDFSASGHIAARRALRGTDGWSRRRVREAVAVGLPSGLHPCRYGEAQRCRYLSPLLQPAGSFPAAGGTAFPALFQRDKQSK